MDRFAYSTWSETLFTIRERETGGWRTSTAHQVPWIELLSTDWSKKQRALETRKDRSREQVHQMLATAHVWTHNLVTTCSIVRFSSASTNRRVTSAGIVGNFSNFSDGITQNSLIRPFLSIWVDGNFLPLIFSFPLFQRIIVWFLKLYAYWFSNAHIRSEYNGVRLKLT